VRFIAGVGDLVPLIIIVFGAAALVSVALTPVVGSVVRRRGLFDHPSARRVNTLPVARGGGIAVVVAFTVIGGIVVVFGDSIPATPTHVGMTRWEPIALFLGGALAAGIGAIDDFFDLRARWQLLGQVGLAIFAIALGVTVSSIANPIGPGPIPFAAPFGLFFTAVWIVGMMNSINFIDGLDGLSSGIALIAAVTLGVLSLTVTTGQPVVALLWFTLAGGLLGFLRWNFHPASIFQGSAGVMFLGYTLAVLSILGAAKVVVALLVLGVPIIDTFWVIVRRLSHGTSPFTPDRGHLHHRLLDLGLGHRATVVLIYAICAVLGAMSLVVSTATQVYAFVGALVGLGLLLFFLAQGTREALQSTSYDDEAT
jgi:UDP-GlcNAc:undecaprenyl-phosphate GlcNAc-1-phosphate transferase